MIKSGYSFLRLLLCCVVIGALSVVSIACSGESTPDVAPIETGNPDSTSTATISTTATPTATPEPEWVLLIAPPEADEDLVDATQDELINLSEQAGLQFEVRPELLPAQVEDNLRVVVVLAPYPGLAELAAADANTQFVGVGISGIQAGANLSLIAPQGERYDRQGFIAGYLAATVTTEWRTGVIGVADTPAGLAGSRAFRNGVVFFCGLCRPVNPPYFEYPQVITLPGSSSQADWQVVADQMIAAAVTTVYIAPGAEDDVLLEYLAGANINLIGEGPVPTGTQDHWVASVGTDWATPLRELWPGLLGGEAGVEIEAPVGIADVNQALLSSGRQRVVEGALADLNAGYIDTGVDPLTGELR